MRKIINKLFRKKEEPFFLRKKNFKLLEVITLVLIATFIGVFSGTFLTYLAVNDSASNSNNQIISEELKEIEDIYKSIMENYYKPVDSQKLIDAAIEGMLGALDDPYAMFMSESEKNNFDERMQGEYRGIGVELINNEEGNIVIYNVFEDTPAEDAGIKKDDIIVGLDGEEMIGVSSSDFANLVKSSSASNFDIQIKRDEEILNLNVAKENIELKSISTEIFNQGNNKIGYINIILFASNTYTQFNEALLLLEESDIDSLIIDVRNNSGGFLHIAKEILSLFFIEDTVIYQLQTRNDIELIYDETSDYREYPISVLINKGSASASEIIAAAFKDNYDSEIIGTASYGKGTVQQTQDLEAGSMIKFTIQKWLTPNGDWIEEVGVEPTVNIELNEKYYTNQVIENDNQLQKAIEMMTN